MTTGRLHHTIHERGASAVHGTNPPRSLYIWLFSVFMLSLLLPPPAWCDTDADGKAAFDAWQELRPAVEIFWNNRTESPYMAGKSAWDLISSLKNYIRRFPDSHEAPQAYFVLGEAYSAVGYKPEAVAHWRITARHFPDSAWAGEALNALISHMQERGDQAELHRFYRAIMRQYPDTQAAKTAWILMAIETVEKGKTDAVAREVKRLENRMPDIHIKTPRFLDLKARLAQAGGHEGQARELWLHYLNLARLPSQKTAILFRIAESYRQEGRMLKARKYYTLAGSSFPACPEALFARFRLAQMKNREKKRIASYVGDIKPGFSSKDPAELFLKIIDQYPAHPIIGEVISELMDHRLAARNDLEILRIALKYRPNIHDPTVAGRMDKAVLAAVKNLSRDNKPPGTLKQAAALGRTIAANDMKAPGLSRISRTVQHLWTDYINQLVAQGHPSQALEEAEVFRKSFPAPETPGRIFQAEMNALLAFDKKSLAEGQPIALLNFHSAHKNENTPFSSPRHLFYVAMAWNALGCPEAAMRTCFRAWKTGPEPADAPALMFLWAQTALHSGKPETAGNILLLFESRFPNLSGSAESVYLNAAVAYESGDFLRASEMLSGIFRPGRQSPARESGADIDMEEIGCLFVESSIMSGNWTAADSAWQHLAPRLSYDRKKQILGRWGDSAFAVGHPAAALQAYNRLIALDPENPANIWRLAMAKEKTGAADTALEGWKSLTQSENSLWAGAAGAVLANEEFLKGPAGELRTPGDRP